MSPKAAGLAVKYGYTNVKVFSGGDPEWAKADQPFVSSAKFVKEDHILLLDLRTADKFAAGHIPRALNLPAANLENYQAANFPDYKGTPVVFYSDNMTDIAKGLELLWDIGFTKGTYFHGGVAKWQKLGNQIETGPKPAPAKLIYVRKLAPHEISIPDFVKMLTTPGVVILDARSSDEFASGKFKGAINVPSENMEKRFNEVPKDKPVYIHCATGMRAEMAYDILKGKGYTNVKLLKANITFTGNEYKITD